MNSRDNKRWKSMNKFTLYLYVWHHTHADYCITKMTLGRWLFINNSWNGSLFSGRQMCNEGFLLRPINGIDNLEMSCGIFFLNHPIHQLNRIFFFSFASHFLSLFVCLMWLFLATRLLKFDAFFFVCFRTNHKFLNYESVYASLLRFMNMYLISKIVHVNEMKKHVPTSHVDAWPWWSSMLAARVLTLWNKLISRHIVVSLTKQPICLTISSHFA